jgi:hypothetical protein
VLPGTRLKYSAARALLPKHFRDTVINSLIDLLLKCKLFSNTDLRGADPGGGRSLPGTAGSNPAGGKDVSCECCVLSGRGLCVRLITRPEESY